MNHKLHSAIRALLLQVAHLQPALNAEEIIEVAAQVIGCAANNLEEMPEFEHIVEHLVLQKQIDDAEAQQIVDDFLSTDVWSDSDYDR